MCSQIICIGDLVVCRKLQSNMVFIVINVVDDYIQLTSYLSDTIVSSTVHKDDVYHVGKIYMYECMYSKFTEYYNDKQVCVIQPHERIKYFMLRDRIAMYFHVYKGKWQHCICKCKTDDEYKKMHEDIYSKYSET